EAWNVNDAGWRELPTEIAAYQTGEERPSAQMGTMYQFKRLHSPRLLKYNPFLSGITNVWSAWKCYQLNEFGSTLLEAEVIFNAEGELSARAERKLNSEGRRANKIVYQLPRPPPENWQTVAMPDTTNYLRLNLAGPIDLSRCDFIAFYLDAPAAEV